MDKLVRKASVIGGYRGKAAASWVFNGNTPDSVYRRFLKGLEDLDPEVMDMLPQSPLSGEWADAYTVRNLAEEIGVDADSVDLDALADAFDEAWHDAVYDDVHRQALSHVMAGV